MQYSAVCRSVEEVQHVAQNFDALIVGSDQVWNSFFYDDPVFFLGFEFDGLRISYAACCGHTPDLPNIQNAGNPARWLLDFDSISVRNDFSRDVVLKLVEKEACVSADPTLLIDYEQKSIPPPKKWKDRQYIAAYVLGDEIHGGHKAAIDRIRQRAGSLPVVAIASSAHMPCRFPWADHVVWTAGPGEWIGWIESAEFLYTDSFHGMIFAMKYALPFIAYYREIERAERLLDLASRYQTENFVVDHADQIFPKSDQSFIPDYQVVHQLMRDHTTRSMAYLQCALENRSSQEDI
jgi:hypothetical protein